MFDLSMECRGLLITPRAPWVYDGVHHTKYGAILLDALIRLVCLHSAAQRYLMYLDQLGVVC